MNKWIQFTNRGGTVIKGDKPSGTVIPAPLHPPYNIPMEYWKCVDGNIVEMTAEEKAQIVQETLVYTSPTYNPDTKAQQLEASLTQLQTEQSKQEQKSKDFFAVINEELLKKDDNISDLSDELKNEISTLSEEVDVIYDNQTTLASKLDSIEHRISKYTQDSLLLKSQLLALEQDLDNLEIDGALKNENAAKQLEELKDSFKEHQHFVHNSILDFDKMNQECTDEIKKDMKEAFKFVHDTFSVPKIEHIHHINVFKYKEYLKIMGTSVLVYIIMHFLMH